ncbi:hypothetical protein [Campylobacter troglodytis]|nr:hypothetical protein [Campylobacter troglodytis]
MRAVLPMNFLLMLAFEKFKHLTVNFFGIFEIGIFEIGIFEKCVKFLF